MPVRPNKVKHILRDGGTVLSSSVRLPEPGLVEILGYAGFDFVLIDGEHGSMGWADMERMVLAAFAAETVPVVRVWKNEPELVMRALDLGAQGILIPHCRTVDDARRLRAAGLYAPEGNRGIGPARGRRWGTVPADEYYATINREVLLLAMIEDPEAVKDIDAIAAVGLDVLWVGTGDLAAAYGVPGQLDHPKVREAAERVLAAGKKANVAVGFPAQSAEDAIERRRQGYRAIGYGGAESYVMTHARQYLSAMRR